jgi:hypothetical protein
MKRINIHHFPQNPFQEQIHHRHHHHHHRRYSFGYSHRNSLHSSHHHHHFLTSFTSRTLKSSFDSTRLSSVREQLEIPISTDNIETNVTSTPEEPPTPQIITDTRSDLTSLSNEDNRIMTHFLKDYLGHDGTLVLYLLKINTNEVITGEIVTALFELFKTNYRTNTTE